MKELLGYTNLFLCPGFQEYSVIWMALWLNIKMLKKLLQEEKEEMVI